MKEMIITYRGEKIYKRVKLNEIIIKVDVKCIDEYYIRIGF